ncbi:MAG: PKD domain-containing protein [Bacteroidetes bacterium]|nr:PKD domain-containing protein [Bacteroidota bacterium]
MHTSYWAIVFTCLSSQLFAQIQIAGVINEYSKVIGIEPCEAKLTVTDATLFAPSSKVLLIQMGGATINSSNSSSFGNIEDLGSAGSYEINEVLSVVGNDVFLKFELLNDYNPTSKLQLVTIPYYNSVSVTGEVQAKAWDGVTGGVLVFDSDTLQLQASINVSGKGFRGAQKLEVVSDCNFLTNADAYFYPINNWRGSPKGEGVSDFILNKEHGRGAQANGGGGGNDHNSGGGGGGNVSNGGIGGKESVGGFGCDGDYPGLGGKSCPNDPERIFMGGGGGAGHFDDTGAGSSGANGGGIAIVLAKIIFGNGFSISANGENASLAHGDGAGGGGAGGSILIKSNSIVGSLSIEAKGGDGGNVNNNADRCDGTGGGGSGGLLITNAGAFTQINLLGGQPGVNNTVSSQCNGQSNGAMPGETGLQSYLNYLAIAESEVVPVQIVEQPLSVALCEGDSTNLLVEVEGNNLVFQWQVNTGSGWQNIPPGPNYSGELTKVLTIHDSELTMDGYLFRCQISSPCLTSLFSESAMLNVSGLPSSSFSVTAFGNSDFLFQNTSTEATNYLWDFGDGNISLETSPSHHFNDFGDYEITLTSTGPCGEDEFVYFLSITDPSALPVAQFSADVSSGCSPVTVQFQNQSTGNNLNSFLWQFSGGAPNISTAENPSVIYNQPGQYPVTLIVSNMLGSDTSSISDFVLVNPTPSGNFSFTTQGYTVFFDNQSVGGTSYFWDFGDGNSSQLANPIHEYSVAGLYDVVLTVNNVFCGSSIMHEVLIGPSGVSEKGQGRVALIYPNPATSRATILLKSRRGLHDRNFQLRNTNGTILQSTEFQGDTLEFSVGELTKGIYFVEILDGHQLYVVKFVKL